MLKGLKKFFLKMMAGANIVTVIIMLLVGMAGRLSPAEHPMLTNAGLLYPVFLLINLAFMIFWLTFHCKGVLIPIVGYLLCYGSLRVYLPLNMPADAPDDAIKVMTYNVCRFAKGSIRDDGTNPVIEYIKQSGADIVCLQEDNDSWRRYCFKQLEERGLTYNDTVVLFNDELRFNCLGIHSKYPIIRRERIDYKTVSNNGSAAWWLKVNEDTVIVVNNHVESCHLNEEDRRQYRQMLKGDMARDSVRAESQLLMVKLAEANAVRSKQIETVCQYVSQYLGRYPIIVCGDFNDNPISFSRHRMGKMLTDCFVESGRGVGLSYNQKAFSFRIDHIFCSADITPYQCEVDTKMDASDHFPMVCWLKIGVK